MTTVRKGDSEMRIERGDVHLWFAFPGTWLGAGRVDGYRAVLSSAELDRLSRFRFAKDQDLYLVIFFIVREFI